MFICSFFSQSFWNLYRIFYNNFPPEARGLVLDVQHFGTMAMKNAQITPKNNQIKDFKNPHNPLPFVTHCFFLFNSGFNLVFKMIAI